MKWHSFISVLNRSVGAAATGHRKARLPVRHIGPGKSYTATITARSAITATEEG